MRELHVTAEVLDRFARGDLDDAGLFDVVEHLETCEACARAGQDRAANDLTALRTGWTSEPAVRRRPVYVWTLAAAAAIAIALLSVLLMPRERPSPRDPGQTIATPRPGKAVPVIPSRPAPAIEERYHDPEWQRAVTRALRSERLPFPKSLEELSGPEDTVRGGTGSAERVAPAGVVVDEVRPTFTWPSRKGGTYTLFVFDDDREVMQSPRLQRPRWTPDRDLPRGRTLTWQVEVTGLEDFETIPSPPSPPARFRIVKEAEHRELVEARERHPGDHLLLSILYARNGMRAEALEALRRAAAGDEAAKRILDHETSPAP
ncbi:MAG TPA: hypothetical protein VEK57_24410 [Thermoanaerobaculia bacterium]|nr:hypothetical protein [Thermoanaerobaculia bacterium]